MVLRTYSASDFVPAAFSLSPFYSGFILSSHYTYLYQDIAWISRINKASRRPQELKPEDFNLWLPSQLPDGTPIDQTLAGHEWELHYAQALDALNEVHSHLRLRSHMYKYKDKNVRGQAGSTHTKKIIDAMESRKHASVLKYRRARSALLSLGHRLEKCSWELTMRPLLDSDVKPMGDMEQQWRGTISWIWYPLGVVQGLCPRTPVVGGGGIIARRDEMSAGIFEMARVLVEGVHNSLNTQLSTCTRGAVSFQRLWSDVPTLVSGGVLILESGEIDAPTIDTPPQL
ncbi:uncharacterized protein F5147DRAFT_656285 [Suillus discolor]|uniref:Uncharacterized protein n=1 Tax=Suillus discolor TaxID=1912936 RepID=A0A9P7EZH1_9AGAM|nr:uncharacterized protein F5147DRAFT_656285 [Suillus discolor]KAG2097747.1 hypothetical protein F5147DRAFT_656285 [Suillus discolor]